MSIDDLAKRLRDRAASQPTENRGIRRERVRRAREAVSSGTLEEEVDMDFVVDSLLPDLDGDDE